MGYGIMAAGAAQGVEQYRDDKRQEKQDAMRQERHETLQRNRDQQYGIRADEHQAWQQEQGRAQDERAEQEAFEDAYRRWETARDPSGLEEFATEIYGVPTKINPGQGQVEMVIGDQQVQVPESEFNAQIQSMREPGARTEYRQNLRAQQQEADRARTEHRQDIQGRIASNSPERVSFDEQGNPVISDPQQNADDLFSLAKINVRDVDPAVLAEAEQIYQQTGDRAQALRTLSRGVRRDDESNRLKRLADVWDLSTERMPPDGYDPVGRFVSRNGKDAKAYGIQATDPYGVALEKYRSGLAEDLGIPAGEASAPDPSGGSPDPGGQGGPAGGQQGDQKAGDTDLTTTRTFEFSDGSTRQASYQQLLDAATEAVSEGESVDAQARELSQFLPDELVGRWYEQNAGTN